MKRKIRLTMAAMTTAAVLAMAGCSSSGGGETVQEQASAKEKGDAIQVASVIDTEAGKETLNRLAENFEKETGIDVEILQLADFEETMKTRMASGELPDIWTTHGWSVRRYSEYLAVLNDQPWYDRVDEAALGVIKDDGGNIYVLPLTTVVTPICCNFDVLEEAGVDPKEIRTLADFEEACEKVKAIGKVPIYIGGKDFGNASGFMNSFAPMMFTNEGCPYPGEKELLDGTFDWDKYGTLLMEKFAEFVQKGYINEDITTADTVAAQTALGNGDCAFVLRGMQNVTNARHYVENANVGMIPTPSVAEDAPSTYYVGEGTCFGIWKDTEHFEECCKFLEYLAKPEIVAEFANMDGTIPALKDVKISGNYTNDVYNESLEWFKDDVVFDNLFDRKYLPSGMWGVLSDSILEVAVDPSEEGIAAAVELMKENYTMKFEEMNQ